MALSWSRWSDYDQCPRKFFLKYMDKSPSFKMDPMKKSLHLIRGEQLHLQLENYALWKINVVTQPDLVKPEMLPETAALCPIIDRLFETSEFVLPETQLAVNKEWKKTGWFDKDAYYRAIMDLIAGRRNHGIMWDYKSGKYQPYGDECGQLHLSCAMVIPMKGWDYIDVSYLFIDSKRPEGLRVTQEDVPKLIKIFDERSDKVNSETQWAPKKNENCKWCEATKEECPNSSRSIAQKHGF
jgi:CRISPR/Cas system-associated exonuclease Cas4 (RecB family)